MENKDQTTVQPATQPIAAKPPRTRKAKQQAAPETSACEQPAEVQPVIAEKEKAPRKPRAPKEPKLTFDFVGAAIGKYAEGGWNVYRCTNGNINDFIAHREKKIHYVRVVPSNAAEDLRYHGESKNSFIQNSMSNAAIPVFASVKPVVKKGEEVPSGAAISLENVNDKTRVLIGKPATK